MKLPMCRICLHENVKMHSIVNTHLQELYEKLTRMPFKRGDDRPILVCYICHAKLQNCYKLRNNCLHSEKILTDMLNNDKIQPLKLQEFTIYNNLKINHVVNISIPEVSLEVKEDLERGRGVQEQSEVKTENVETYVKLENNENSESYYQNDDDFDDSIQAFDSEDDLPLNNIKKDTESKVKRKKGNRVRKKETIDKKTYKIDAKEIILTKEEQLSNLLARSKSSNYIMSTYKCDKCYKGFIDNRAYDNHNVKHDERSGNHICDICKMRYKTPQQLKSHIMTSHERLYKCLKCGHTTHTANQARVHEKWHNGHIYECQLCSHKFKKPTSYLTHMRKRHPTEHVCNICGESFVGKHGLLMHKSKTHRDEENNEQTEETESDRYCSDCDILFYSRDAWKKHILCSVKHTLKNDTSTECKICGWRVDSTSLSNHMKEHSRNVKKKITPKLTDRAQCRCNQCGLYYISRSKLQSHINRVHLGLKYNKNIVCEVCGKHCTSNATLIYHQRTHTGEKPYSCTTCSKRFSDSNRLRIHTRTHTGEKPYVCAVCGKRFSQKPALNRHYRVHTGDKPYSCQYCSRTFSQSNSLKLHVRTVHHKLPANNKRKAQDVVEKIEEKVLLTENLE